MARILIVEDESVVAWHIQEALETLGHKVIAIAQTAKEAIKLSTDTQPDLVLMDIQLQGNVDGVAAAEYIYFQLNLPVVYLTAHADEQTLQRATETSPFGYLVKPFQEAELHSTIKIALRRHQLERAHKDAQQWYATTLISIGDATIATDVDGFVAFMNPTAEILTGWEQEQALGEFATRVLDLVHEETGEAIANPLLSAMCSGDTVMLPSRTLLRARDGTLRPVGDSAAPIRNREGQIIGGIMVFQDLSDRRHQEALLQRENQILERSRDRLTLQLRERNEQLQQALTCTQLVQRILNQSRSTPGLLPLTEINLSQWFLEIGDRFTIEAATHNQQFVADIPSHLLVKVHLPHLEQILNELLTNAGNFAPSGAQINLTVELKDDRVDFTVTNTGIEISQSEQTRIFWPFYRLTSANPWAKNGSGLGLPLVKKLAIELGGEISVSSQTNQTSFRLELPMILGLSSVR